VSIEWRRRVRSGDVKTMTVDEKVKPLTMGWCVSCHEQNYRVNSVESFLVFELGTY
jgi:hypothetical protein